MSPQGFVNTGPSGNLEKISQRKRFYKAPSEPAKSAMFPEFEVMKFFLLAHLNPDIGSFLGSTHMSEKTSAPSSSGSTAKSRLSQPGSPHPSQAPISQCSYPPGRSAAGPSLMGQLNHPSPYTAKNLSLRLGGQTCNNPNSTSDCLCDLGQIPSPL